MQVRVGRIGVEDRWGQVQVGQDKDWDGQLEIQAWEGSPIQNFENDLKSKM